jgi:hypothetical protein
MMQPTPPTRTASSNGGVDSKIKTVEVVHPCGSSSVGQRRGSTTSTSSSTSASAAAGVAAGGPLSLAKLFLERFSGDEQEELREFLRACPQTYGSVCSGTDAVVLCGQALIEALGVPSDSLEHLFSCEKDEKKRQFLLDMYSDSLQHLFCDVSRLLSAAAFDCVSKTIVKIPKPRGLVG